MKKILATILFFLMTIMSSYAKDAKYTIATLKHDIKASVEIPKNIFFVNSKDIILKNKTEIPKNSYIEAEIIKFQRELRWHKSAYLIVKLLNYTKENSEEKIDVSDQDTYLTIRKYERFDKKEATIVATELIAFNAADFFAPGSGVAYFFIKGAATKEKHAQWFKSGVSNAYDNSIFWFILKGKNMELDENDEIKVEQIDGKKLQKAIEKIDKRKLKDDKKLAKKEEKARKEAIIAYRETEKEQIKISKMKPQKREKYLAKKEEKARKKAYNEDLIQLRNKIWKEKWDEIDDRRTEELKTFARQKQEKIELKNRIKVEKKELKETLKSMKGKEKTAYKSKVKEDIKEQKEELKNKIKLEKQEMKLNKKALKKETKQIKKEAKNWYKEYKKSVKKEVKQIKKEPVIVPYDAESQKDKIYNLTVSKKLQTL